MAKGDGVEEDITPKFTLEFVNVGAVSQAEKERNQRLIRSTAMRSFRRRQQSERSRKGEGSSKDSAKATCRPKSRKSSQSDEKSVSPTPSTDLSSETTFSEVSWLMGVTSNDQKADYFTFADLSRNKSSSSQSSSAPSIVDSPVTPLGAGRVDPFRMLPVEASSHINELIDHCESSFYLLAFGSCA